MNTSEFYRGGGVGGGILAIERVERGKRFMYVQVINVERRPLPLLSE